MTAPACYLNSLGLLCSIGDSKNSVEQSLRSARKNTTLTDAYSTGQPLPIGLYQGELPAIPLPNKKWQSRNNQFALAALQQIQEDVSQAIKVFGAHRIAVIIGTSTSGISESEPAIKEWALTGRAPDYYDYGLQEMGATAQFIAEVLAVKGPVYGISTACSSGAKALASARRLIQSGICDAVIAGGVDTLCQLTVQGFSSLQAVSPEPCNPFSKNRKGINIGEGAALFLVSRRKAGVELCGAGESSDAHHISAPDPSGKGAIKCMSGALSDAKIKASDIGYVNLHGTATTLNDAMESTAMRAVFGDKTLCSSSKPYTGHTLGAAGALEAGICWLMLSTQANQQFLPEHLWDGVADPALAKINLVNKQQAIGNDINYALSNSFAFGGSNISLLLGRIQ